MIRGWILRNHQLKKFSKSAFYARIRQNFPMAKMSYIDDSLQMPEAEKVIIDWPKGIEKPVVGLIKDFEHYPRWTKFKRFLENNSFPYKYYDLHAVDWIEKAAKIDVFLGIVSNEFYHLEEMRKKYYFLEKILGKSCFPSFDHIFLYESKTLEAYFSKAMGIPFAPTYIYNDEIKATQAIEKLEFPLISKTDPTSGSMGVEWVRDKKQGQTIIKHAFSNKGRPTYSPYFRQKNYVYFQKYIENDGYDIRVIVIGDYFFGYYRKVLTGDFRASGMNMVEKRALPEDALRLSRAVYEKIKSPILVVDMVHSTDGSYYIVEFSPACQIETPEQLRVNGLPGVYIYQNDASFQFKPGKYWVHELALKEFLLKDYLGKD
jgi:glutathione synthase/RimK-type ligase-like ATP-grasp enzyme